MTATTEEKYKLLVEQARALIEGEDDWIANTANLSALLFNSLNDVNFAGVYRYENGELILGPFQGMPACVHIQMGKGVCGTAAQEIGRASCRERVLMSVGEVAWLKKKE